MTEHKAVIMGQIYRKHFNFRSYWYKYSEIEETVVLDRYEKIWKGSISSNKLLIGDYIYIDELDVKVKVLNRIVSIEGITTYETDHFIRTEKNEKSASSFKISQKRKEYYDKEEEEQKVERLKELEIEREMHNKSKKTWFERIFG